MGLVRPDASVLLLNSVVPNSDSVSLSRALAPTKRVSAELLVATRSPMLPFLIGPTTPVTGGPGENWTPAWAAGAASAKLVATSAPRPSRDRVRDFVLQVVT